MTVPIKRSFGKMRSSPDVRTISPAADRLVVDDVVEPGVGIATTFDDAVRARVGKQGAGAAVFVVDEQNLRGRRQNLHDFTDDAVRSNNGHVAAHVVAIAAIQEQRVRSGIGARADHLCREHRRFRMRLAEIQYALRRWASPAWLSSSRFCSRN